MTEPFTAWTQTSQWRQRGGSPPCRSSLGIIFMAASHSSYLWQSQQQESACVCHFRFWHSEKRSARRYPCAEKIERNKPALLEKCFILRTTLLAGQLKSGYDNLICTIGFLGSSTTKGHSTASGVKLQQITHVMSAEILQQQSNGWRIRFCRSWKAFFFECKSPVHISKPPNAAVTELFTWNVIVAFRLLQGWNTKHKQNHREQGIWKHGFVKRDGHSSRVIKRTAKNQQRKREFTLKLCVWWPAGFPTPSSKFTIPQKHFCFSKNLN